MSTILLTGGAGFIGSHIAETYTRKGWRVAIVDDFSSGTMENLAAIKDDPNVTIYHADIRDRENLRDIFAEVRPDVVNHHAAQKSVADSVTDPLHDLDINGRGWLNVLLAAGEYGVKNIIYVSSGGALSKIIEGDEKSQEIDPPQLISPYAIHKYGGEQYLANYQEKYGYEYTILRYANVYGPRQIPDGECGVIPIFVNNVRADRPSVLFTYPDMPRGCSRDYVHVDDVVRANVMAQEKPANEPVNIGSGEEIYILDIYEKICDVFGSDAPIAIEGPREGDIRRSVLAADRARALWGWRPQVTWQEGLQSLKNE